MRRALGMAAVLALLATAAPAAAGTPATPRADCGPGSRPEPGLQGRVPGGPASAAGFACNATLVGHLPGAGGYKVERFVDRSGRACAYYDTTLLFPIQAFQNEDARTGVAVVDITDPARPVRTDTLSTPAMQTPHESLLLNQRRGLLVAVMGNPTLYPGFVDVYDVNADCRHPQLQSSLPVGLLGHESGFAPDGLTFYATSLFSDTVTAVDLTDPKAPRPLWVGRYPSHGFTVSEDGNRGYVAGLDGLVILDTSEVQARRPNPQVREVARLDWPNRSIPQVALPVTIGGRPYLVEVDEFSVAEHGSSFPAANGPIVGAARMIDIADERHPRVVSEIRLEVHQPEHRAEVGGDPGAQSTVQGYAGHYCGVPRSADPGIVACSFILSGLRVFDIRDPRAPREIAYYVAPPAPSPVLGEVSDYAMSRPAFAPERGEIYYSDGNSGFYAVRVAPGVWPFAASAAARCSSRRSFTIHLARRLRSARVYVDGRRVAVRRRRGRLTARVDLRGKPRKVVRVRIVGRTARGRVVRDVRRYRTCTPGTRRGA